MPEATAVAVRRHFRRPRAGHLARVVDASGLNRSRVARDALAARVSELEQRAASTGASVDATARRLPPVLDVLSRFPEIERVILFGGGDAGPRADIDIAISCPRADTRTWLAILYALDEAETLLHIDAVRAEDAGAEILREVARTGRVVYEPGDAAALPGQSEPGA